MSTGALSVDAYQCLKDHGYAPVEPPSLEKFMADYRSEGVEVPYLPHMAAERGASSLPEADCARPTLQGAGWGRMARGRDAGDRVLPPVQ